MSVSQNVIAPIGQSFHEEGAPARLIPKALSNAAARLVDSLKINSVSERVQRGRRLVIKRRMAYSEPLAELTNVYFRMAGIPIRFWAKTEEWRRWEISCFNMLNGECFHARLSGANGVCPDRVHLERYRAFAARRARQTRRASITCHVIRPGIPRTNSRTRAIKESAKAASPGMPSKLPTRT